MRLSEYLKKKNIKPSRAATEIGVTRMCIHYWLNRPDQMPQKRLRDKVTIWSRGMVKGKDWV